VEHAAMFLMDLPCWRALGLALDAESIVGRARDEASKHLSTVGLQALSHFDAAQMGLETTDAATNMVANSIVRRRDYTRKPLDAFECSGRVDRGARVNASCDISGA
jgi:hypothetical protein